MKPNIFSIATKELSQDGFFTWLLQWGDSSNAQYDTELNLAGQDFVRLLINHNQQFISSDLSINTVVTFRQWKNIDILALVNDDYIIVIEDKTDSIEHSEQLQRYKDAINQQFPKKNNIFIYLKTGNESTLTLNKVIEKGYSVINRKSVLNILQNRNITNQIFIDFAEHLSTIEGQTNDYQTLASITSSWRAAEGFYLALQDELQGGGWKYVSNKTGGFLGFWYNWERTPDYSLYIQIENALGREIKLVVKISDWKPNIIKLYSIFEDLQKIALGYNLKLSKPKKYRAGSTSTVAIIENAFPAENESVFELDGFIKTLSFLQKTLSDHRFKLEAVNN